MPARIDPSDGPARVHTINSLLNLGKRKSAMQNGSEGPYERDVARPTYAGGGLALLSSERGATSVEYALIVSLIAAVIALTVALVGADTLNLWQRVDW